MMALFASCSSKALKQTFEGDNQFDSVWTYLFVAALLSAILAQTHFLNKAMMLGDLMSVIPTFQAFWIVFGVLSGMAFYGHSEGMSYPGLLLMIAGVLFLLQHPRLIAGEDVMGAEAAAQKLGCTCCCPQRSKQKVLDEMEGTDEYYTDHDSPKSETKVEAEPTPAEAELTVTHANI